jgi:hypothetical protein
MRGARLAALRARQRSSIERLSIIAPDPGAFAGGGRSARYGPRLANEG